MKVILLNGSRREKGCTYTGLAEVAKALNAEGIETEIIHALPEQEAVNEVAEKMKTASGLVLGSPVYWASPTGEMMIFMDKLSAVAGKDLMYKPAASIASARRAGTTATIDVLNKYLAFHQMPIVSTNYWPMIHGNTPEEVKQDLEGMQIMEVLGRNMAWLLKAIAVAEANGVAKPAPVEKIRTNFVR